MESKCLTVKAPSISYYFDRLHGVEQPVCDHFISIVIFRDYSPSHIRLVTNRGIPLVTPIKHKPIVHSVSLDKGGGRTWDAAAVAHLNCNTQQRAEVILPRTDDKETL
jgi:hypothetical protein